MPLTFLPGLLDGLGVLANYTYIDADKVPTALGGTPQSLNGLSDSSYNLGGYYEKGGFGVRLSYNYRTEYLVDGGVFGDGGYNRAFGQLDAQANYDITPNLAVTADMNNLTGEKSYIDNGIGVLRNIHNPGRRFAVGIRAKFRGRRRTDS